MNIHFTKMHGLGNDFMVVDGVTQNAHFTSLQIQQLSRRDTGIGFDQFLLVEPSTKPEIDFFYRIFNANGQEVGQCGNGARCIARFIQHYGLSKKLTLNVATQTTRMVLTLNNDNSVTVNMGHPNLTPRSIPINVPAQENSYSISLPENEFIQFHAISIGNPHAVIPIDNVLQAPINQIGQFISEHPLFPEQANVGFMEIVNHEHVRLRVYERGCGETQACGSGAVAAAAIGRLYHTLSETIKVSLPGGDLFVHWPNLNDSIYLTGPAEFVYEGRILCTL